MFDKFKRSFSDKKEWFIGGGLFLFLLIGSVLFVAGLEFILLSTPVVLAVILGLVLYFWDQPLKTKYVALAVVSLFGFLVELVGVKTGLLFGDYTYGNLLGWKIFGTPLMIGLLWFIVSLSCWQISGLYWKHRLVRYGLAVVLLVSFDLVLEQFAISYKFWSWQNISVPLSNYLTWALVGSLIFLFYDVFLDNNKKDSPFIILLLPILSVWLWIMLLVSTF